MNYAQGAIGPRGSQGPTGTRGPRGHQGVSYNFDKDPFVISIRENEQARIYNLIKETDPELALMLVLNGTLTNKPNTY